jgi:hypothetical protein
VNFKLERPCAPERIQPVSLALNEEGKDELGNDWITPNDFFLCGRFPRVLRLVEKSWSRQASHAVPVVGLPAKVQTYLQLDARP